MDVLSDIVGVLDLRSSLYFRAEFSAPFAVSVPEDRHRIRFHVAGPGRSWIGLPSGEQAFYETGDLVLVPHGAAHTLASTPVEPVRSLEQVLSAEPLKEGLLRYGGGGEPAQLVCGHFEFDETLIHPLVASLPPLLHVPARESGFGWMPPLLECVEQERARQADADHGVERAAAARCPDPRLSRAQRGAPRHLLPSVAQRAIGMFECSWRRRSGRRGCKEFAG